MRIVIFRSLEDEIFVSLISVAESSNSRLANIVNIINITYIMVCFAQYLAYRQAVFCQKSDDIYMR